MAPKLVPRDSVSDEEGEGVHGRTRIDDTDSRISFSPASSPYSPQHSTVFTVVNDARAYNGTAVELRDKSATITFSFPGDSLTIGFLHNALGMSAKLSLENGTEYPFQVTPDEARALSPNGDKSLLQKKLFRLDGLSCTNHTATLTPGPPVVGSKDGRDATSQASLYFDWFSYVVPDNPASCFAKGGQASSLTRAASNATPVEHSHYKTMEYAGIGVGAVIFSVISAALVYVLWRRKRRHSEPPVDRVNGDWRFDGFQAHDVAPATTQPTMSQRSREPLLEAESAYRPRGLHALAHDESFASAQTDNLASVVDSPSANTIFPLLPASSSESLARADDVGFCIGRTLLDLQHEPAGRFRGEARHSGARLHYQKARTVSAGPAQCVFPSHDAPSLIGGHVLHRMPKEGASIPRFHQLMHKSATSIGMPMRESERPRTTSAVERLRSEARQLDVHRPLSPFTRSRPTTSSGTFRHHSPLLAVQQRLATAPTHSACRQIFKRNSSASASGASIDTHWSRESATEPVLPTQAVTQLPLATKSLLQVPNSVSMDAHKTTDSEAEMWISRRKTLAFVSGKKSERHSSVEPPRRPPKSPHRPSTGQAPPPPMSHQPSTVS